MAKPENFDTNVFINCPFDLEYRPLLNAIVFAVVACGFTPCLALEERDAAAVRLDKIKRLIGSSRLGLHDISRTASDVSSGLPRFNMPFELGLDIGARHYGSSYLRQKRLLIFDKEQYRYQQFLSDIAGQDISTHDGSVDIAIAKVRDWLNAQKATPEPLLGAGRIQAAFADFLARLPEMCARSHLDPANLDFNDYLFYVGDYAKLTL
jgi:hypothetical protein